MQIRESFKTMSKGSTINVHGKLRELDIEVPVSNIISIDMIAGTDSELENLGFTWKVSRFTQKSMDVSLDFEYPLFVSSQGDRDQLNVTFKSSDLFIDEDYMRLEEDITLIKIVPKQYADKQEKITLE